MKKIQIFIYILAVMAGASAHAQTADKMQVRDLTLELKDGYLNLDMDIDMSQLKVKGTQVVVLTPYIVNGTNSVALNSIGVYGRNRRLFYLRNEEQRPTSDEDADYRKSDIDEILSYNDSVAFINWMDGCSLSLVRTDFGCCGGSEKMSDTVLVSRFPLEPYHPELIYIKPKTEAVKLRHISGSAFVDFPVSQTEIMPEYRNNVKELNKIIGTIDSVKQDKDIIIKSIFIKGFASPESPYENNANLAKRRTESLKEYVQSLYHFEDSIIKTAYEPEDWDGLERYVVASNLPNKEKILAEIRSDIDPDIKEWRIRSTWKNDYKFLLENCYPSLRHSDYTIEYEIRGYGDPKEIEEILHTSPQKLSLEEFFVLSKTYDIGSREYHELFKTAVRMYPDNQIANLNAANSSILNKDYDKALRYLDKAGNLPEAIYARGALEVYRENFEAARPYLEEALRLGVTQAEITLKEISVNRYVYKMSDN